jgi:Tfp pilus assembly protein PilX
MNKPILKAPNVQRQSGISLLMALVLLAGIMLIGVLSYSVSNTQFKLSGNQQFEAAAMNEAEAALSVAEAWLIAGGSSTGNRRNAAFDQLGCTTVLYSGTPGLYRFINPVDANCPAPSRAYPSPREAPFDLTIEANWAGSNVINVPGQPGQQYMIQKIAHNVCKRGNSKDPAGKCVGGGTNIYRVIARGTSPKGAQRIIETTMVLDIAD